MKKNALWVIVSAVVMTGLLSFAPSANNIVNAQSNGIGSAIPAYYDSKLFTIIFVEFSSKAEQTLIAHNSGLNFIYQYDPGINGEPFISVIDAVPGDGMNPVWEEIQIQFNTIPPQQFFSDDQILTAAASGAITLIPTGEVYKCPVIGNKPK
jgi:hypothetical protein